MYKEARQMITNQGSFERTVRVIIGLILVWVALYKAMNPAWLWFLAIAGLIMIVTGLSGYCPVWQLLKINTSKKK